MDDTSPPEPLPAHRVNPASPRRRSISGANLCGIAALLLCIASMSAWSVLTDSSLGADFDSGTHTAHTAGTAVLALLSAVAGAIAALAACDRGPVSARLLAIILLVIAFLMVPTCGFVALLSLQ